MACRAHTTIRSTSPYPAGCPGVPDGVLDARGTWADKEAYDGQARDLVGRFHANFTQFAREVEEEVLAAAPMAA